MQETDRLLGEVHRHCADIQVEDDELVLYGGEHIPPELKSELKKYKAKLISDLSANDIPLAAKLRALGSPIALEVNGETACWIVSDDAEAAKRTDLQGAVFTAQEAETLAQFDAKGIHDLIRLKQRLGGRLAATESTTTQDAK